MRQVKMYEISRRLAAVLLCLCMTVSMICDIGVITAFAADAERTAFTVVHHHTDGGDVTYSGTIDPDGGVHLPDDENVYTAPYVVMPEPETDGDGNEPESFSGFSVEKGDAAVTVKADDPETAGAEIRYEPNTAQVILHVNYRLSDDGPGGDSASGTPSEVPGQDDPADTGEDVVTPAETEGDEGNEGEQGEEPVDEPAPEDGEGGDGSDMGIATIALSESDAEVLKNFCQQYPGEYKLPDGSDWMITVSEDGLKLTGTGAENATIDSITTSGETIKTVKFTSPDWYKNDQKTNNQPLTLTWTTAVNSTYAHKSFKCGSATFYNKDKSFLKGFTTNSYFIADNGIFSYEYFKERKTGDVGYVGDYVLSKAYGDVYDKDIAGIGSWKIEIDENGHVYLCVDEEHKYEAVMTDAGKTNSIERVKTMTVAVPGWYTKNSCTEPAYVKLTWGYDGDSKSSNYGNGALYFETTGLAVYKPNEKGETGSKKAISAYIPPMRFERNELTEFAKSYLKNYENKYLLNDGSEEYIEIGDDGTTVLHIDDETTLTPLYYVVNNAEWITGSPEDSKSPSKVTSVVFSAADWYAQNKAPTTVDRTRLTLNWDELSKQFAVSANATCYKADGSTVSHIYTTDMKFSTEEDIKEGIAYMKQYVKGEYTLNDGSEWKIKVDETTGDIYTKFGTTEYEKVENPAPVFVQDSTYTGENGKGEYGNKGKYLDTITVPVTGWYLDEDCIQDAVVTLNWKGKVYNPIDDHQFNVNAIPLYRKDAGGEVECKYFAGTFYSDADREKGEKFLAELGVAGTYRPTAAEGKWWIEISEEGKVTIHVTDSQDVEHTYEDVAMDLTIDKTKKNGANLNYGNVTAVTDIKVVIPEWRTAQTNDTLANIAQCGEVTFTFTRDQTYVGSSYFTPSNTYIYADADDDGNDWEVKAKKTETGYNKTLITKIYDNDRAYTDANKDAAKDYFKQFPGTYYIEEAGLDYEITITEDGQIYWGKYGSGGALLPADVAFDAIHDANGNGKVDENETTPVPGTISVWLNGYTTGKVSTSSSTKETYNEGTQRADLTWYDTNEWSGTGSSTLEVPNTAHKFKSKSAKGYKVGATSQTTFDADKYYTRGEDVTGKNFVPDGKYETTDANFWIEIKTDEDTGETSYTFHRPEPPYEYPLKLFGTGNAAYLRGKIGMMKKVDVYIVVTKGPYEGFLLTAYEVTYNDLEGKPVNSSNGEQVTLPLGTRFTDYSLGDTGENKNIRVVDSDGEKEYSRLSLALHDVKDGGTIYLEDNIEIGFAAKLPDNVGNVTIDGQGHKILRDSYVNPGTLLMDPEVGKNEAVMSILMDPGISLMALEKEGESGDLPVEHYTGAILQVGEGDTVTLKNVTIDGEGQWEIDEAKLEYDKLLNQDYDINVLDDPNGGHPIKELEGNVVSTDSLIKVNGGTLILDGVTLENFFAGDGYDDDRHFIDFMSKEGGKLEIKSNTVFQHNASRSGVCIGNTDEDDIYLSGCTTMQNNYCFGGNGGLIVAMEGTQVYMEDGTKVVNNVAADTNGVFIQLHKKTDGVKDGDNKGTTYARLHMNGGKINNNVGLRGGSYGWGQTIYLYNGGSFEMNGGEIGNNIGAGISSIYQQPSADALKLNAGWIHDNTCSLIDEGMDKDWALDIALMNIGDIGEDMTVEQNFLVGAAAILGGYASGDEYLTNNGVIKGNISVYSYFNNEGRTSTVVNNNIIDGNIRLENGSMIKNGVDGVITGNVTVRGALTESAGESSFHNEGKVKGNVELAENAHLYHSGEIEGDVLVKSGATFVLNCNDGDPSHGGGIVDGDVTVYPDGLMYAEVTPTLIKGTLTFEYEDEEDKERMEEVLHDSGITCENVVYKQHAHSEVLNEEVIEPDNSNKNDYKCTDPWTKVYTCQTCGKVVERDEIPPTGHDYYVDVTTEATCTKGEIETVRCHNCTAYNSSKGLERQVGKPNGHKYEELMQLYIPPTEYGSGHIYYVCTECGDLLEFEIDAVHDGNTKHTFQNDDGSLKESEGVVTKDPACTGEGEMTFTCKTSGCSAEITIPIPATGHTYPITVGEYTKDCVEVDSRESTCKAAGYIKYAPKCTVCDKPSETFTYQVNSKKLEHDWSEWANVDGDFYPCTMERKQERHCQNDGCDEKETRLGGETTHEWIRVEGDEEIYKCSKCGMVQNGLHVDYDVNGGATTKNFNTKARLTHAPGETVTLWQPTDETNEEEYKNAGIKEEGSEKYWTKSTALGSAVFVGWSTADYGAEPYYEKPTDAKIVEEVTISADNPADVPVYAVWALDRNGNYIPDYDEGKVTLHYDPNGGSGDTPADLTDVLIGASYPLVTVCDLKKGSDVFAGWSTSKTTDVIPGEGATITITTDGDGNPVSRVTWTGGSVDLITSPYKIPKPASGDTVTLYAVYAADDGTGKPAFDDGYYHVEYYAPGATANRDYTVETNGLFYTCNDHHKPGENAELMKTQDASVMVYKLGAVLIGFTNQEDWNKAEHPFVTSVTEEAGVLIESVTIPAVGNAKVYAVWAEDKNNNGIRDYNEPQLTHTYHLNERLLEHSKGDAPTLPITEGGTKSASQLTITNSAKLPDSQNVLTGVYIPFPGTNADSKGANIKFENSNVIGEADLYSADGKTVLHHYIQIGWSGYPHRDARSEKEAASWIIGYDLKDDPAVPGQKKDDNGYLNADGIFHREIKDNRFVNAYVVWALDDNKNGIADFQEHTGGNNPSASSAIDRTEHYGYIVGVTEDEVRPEQNITRAEVATILFRLLTNEARENNWSEDSGFPDVESGAWYNHAVAVLHNLGIVKGDDAGNFNPDDRITRAEMAAMMVRFYEKTERTVLINRFTDVDETKWYAQEVLLADHYGLMQGDGDQFRPEEPLTRAEAMTVFNRLLGRKPHKDHLHKDMTVWTDNVDKSKWYYADVQEATNSHECGRNVVINGKTYETWKSIKPMRDWTALEY